MDTVDNKAREDIMRVMYMRIILNNIRVVTLATICAKYLTFTYHIDFVATWSFGQEAIAL